MKKIALDTNAYTRLLAGSREVLTVLSDAECVYLPVVVIGELLAGFKGGAREHQNRKLLDEFLERETVLMLPATIKTAEIFAEVMHRLKKAGKPIPINDIWIAAQAMESGAFLVTYDKHFENIAGLLLWNAP